MVYLEELKQTAFLESELGFDFRPLGFSKLDSV